MDNIDTPIKPKKINKTENMKEYKKQWKIDNKEKQSIYMRDYMREYYRNNKEKCIEQYEKRKSNKIDCSCGCVVFKSYLEKHLLTKKHKNKNIYLEEIKKLI